jgi:flagellar basal-body rod protein FlgB
MNIDFRSRLFGTTTRQMVYKSLDANAMRSRAISQNIANAMTPGYNRGDVAFADAMRAAMEKQVNGNVTDPRHIELGRQAAIRAVEPRTYRPDDPVLPGEINNVDIDIENAKMAENQIQQAFNIQFAGFGKYNAAIKGTAY